MNPQPAPDFAGLLEASRADFLAAIENVTDEQAAAKPDPARWSVLECIEHVVIVEQRFQGWIESAQPLDQPQHDSEREAALFAQVTDRSARAQAPEVVLPTGRFTTLADARTLFNRLRDRSVRIAQERAGGLYLLMTDQHRRFGPMNGAELMHIIAGHSSRHAAQIREALGAS